MHILKYLRKIIDNETLTKIRKLNAEERIVEIAEMLGGLEILQILLLAHAKQLLN